MDDAVLTDITVTENGYNRPTEYTEGCLDLEEPGARWSRDKKLISEIVQLENELGRELCLADVYQKFGSRIDAISDLLPFLVKCDPHIISSTVDDNNIKARYLNATDEFAKEEIDNVNRAAYYWYHKVGANVISADTKRKEVCILNGWKQYRSSPVLSEVFEKIGSSHDVSEVREGAVMQ
jgi:hypothetical protein